jgi:predicted amidophosphoribosyltransferase
MNEDGSGAFKCPNCSKTTGGNEKFCIDCGQALNIVCPDCGEHWRFMFDVSFCPVCGHNMKPQEPKKSKT